MASLPICFAPATVRVYAATAAKGAGGSRQEKEKSFLDRILGYLQKEDQFYETDPILNKADDDKSPPPPPPPPPSGGGTTSGRKNSVSVPQKKKGGFGIGGLFAEK